MEPFMHLTDELPLAYFLYNKEYTVIDCNRAAVDIFAHGKGINLELVRTYLISQARYTYPNYETDKAFTEQVIKSVCERALSEGSFRFEHTFLTLEGRAIPCEVTIVPVSLEDGQGYVHYLRDLHDNQRVLLETRRREAAEEANRTKSRFLARMSHEIRTPMHAVLGIAELLMKKEHLPNDVMEAVTRINAASGLLMATLDDILDLAKVEAGKIELANSPYELSRLIINTVQLNHVHMNKGLRFDVKVDANLPCRMVGDEMRIRQILNNLLSNAFKYTQVGYVSLSADKEISENDELFLCFTVEDTGQGLTTEQKTRLFDSEFTRFSAQSHIIGSGLGMTVVKQFLTLMDGDAAVESQIGVGTKITVKIPQRAESEEVLGDTLAEALQDIERHRALLASLPGTKTIDIDSSPMPYGKVLVVDDVESNVYVAQGILAHYEIQVDTAINGMEAVEKIEKGAVYDIIFMDHMMPHMDGVEATQAIREMKYTHPIIALTANIVAASEQEFTSRGFDGFISKPIDTGQLARCLDFYIRKKHAEMVFTQAAPPVAKPVVLTVDDSPTALTVLNDILKPHYKILSARSGSIAFNVLEKQKVDLMLLDLAMPEISGFDILERLKETDNSIPVIIISASDEPQDQVRGMAMGAVDFLRKPFDAQTVLQRVKLHLGGVLAGSTPTHREG
ncbi:MAG: response regulator [Defluviitaleaceae bacterium]|nr:response regulator [Defluviitaleaceae bacterium]MCL2273539.1 response regulator [Defluviitaleaceae bacterium]